MIAYLFCVGFEFLLMVLGISLVFNKSNILQTFLHVLGCLFSTWFVLDSWSYSYIWPLWGFFGLTPFVIEIFVIVGAARLNKDISNNAKGVFKY